MVNFINNFQLLLQEGSDLNLLSSAFDVSISFSKDNNFARNIDGIGIIQCDDKFSFSLEGKGDLLPLDTSKKYYFTSSNLYNINGRVICWQYNKNDFLQSVFHQIVEDKIVKPAFLNEINKNIIYSNGKYNNDLQLVIFTCYIQSFSSFHDSWRLNLIEV